MKTGSGIRGLKFFYGLEKGVCKVKVQLRGLKKILKNLRGLKKILKILRGLKKFDYIQKNAPSGYPAERMTGP